MADIKNSTCAIGTFNMYFVIYLRVCVCKLIFIVYAVCFRTTSSSYMLHICILCKNSNSSHTKHVLGSTSGARAHALTSAAQLGGQMIHNSQHEYSHIHKYT